MGEGYSEGKAYREAKSMLDVMDKLQEIWDRAQLQAQENKAAGRQLNAQTQSEQTQEQRETGAESKGKNSIRQEFASEVQDWYNSTTTDQRTTAGGYFEVGTTSDILKKLGARDDRIFWRKYKIGTILENHPEIDIDVIKKVPEILESPILIMKSRTVADSIVMFGNVNTNNGDRVMAALELTPKPSGNMEAEFSLITSAYNRNETSIKHLIENSEILFANKNKVKDWSKSLRVQFPSDQPNLDYIGSITYKDGAVNITGKKFKQLFPDVLSDVYFRMFCLMVLMVLNSYLKKKIPQYITGKGELPITALLPIQYILWMIGVYHSPPKKARIVLSEAAARTARATS